MPSTRIFIGNLTVDTQENDIKKIFSSYGIINKIDIKSKLDIEGNPVSRFAYLNLEAEQGNVNDCVRNTNGSKLKGSILKVEVAKESFLDRLKREREQANQPKDINSNNEISFNYNFKNTNLDKFDKKEYNFSNSSHSSSNVNNYNNKFDNFNSNFENLKDDYDSFQNHSTYRDNNNRNSYDLQDDENGIHTFSSFKRYYPPTSEKEEEEGDKEFIENSNEEEPQAFVNIYSKLSFKEGSSFSLLEKFSAAKSVENEKNAKRKAFELEQSHSNDRVADDKKVAVKRKSRNFFISADDPMFEDAAAWILTPLTEENQEEFDEICSDLRRVNKSRFVSAKRDNFLKKKTRFARINHK